MGYWKSRITETMELYEISFEEAQEKIISEQEFLEDASRDEAIRQSIEKHDKHVADCVQNVITFLTDNEQYGDDWHEELEVLEELLSARC